MNIHEIYMQTIYEYNLYIYNSIYICIPFPYLGTPQALKDYGMRIFKHENLDELIRFLTTPTLRFPTWPVTPSKGLGVDNGPLGTPEWAV